MKRLLILAVVVLSGLAMVGGSRGNMGSAKSIKALEGLYGTGMFGTVGAATALEGLDGMHRTVLSVRVTGADKVTLADGAHGGGTLVYTFPEGQVAILGAVFNGTVTNTDGFNAHAADTFSFGVGVVVGADDDALTGTEQNLIASQAVDTVGGTTLTRAVGVVGPTTPVYVDGTSSAATAYVNFAIAAANNSAAVDFTASGTLTVVWALLGDK
jgi:hypothetical protein